MRYFDYLPEADRAALFARPPQPFSKAADREILRGGLGGLLYTPAVNPDIAGRLCAGRVRGLSSLALCLEDAVGDLERAEAERNAVRQLDLLQDALERGALSPQALPLIFIRVQDVPMLERLADVLVRRSPVLAGVILPKVTPETLAAGLSVTADIARRAADPFYAMPILESAALMTCRRRLDLLREMEAVTSRYFAYVLNVRVGATDLCGLCGVRRRTDTPVYHIASIAACIADIVRVFALRDRYTVSGPVWEYYRPVAQALEDGRWDEIRGLLAETALDQQNGLCGKTCAHPAQLLPVQAGYVVPWEDYQDAVHILETGSGRAGVLASAGRNKMNESRPHALWAEKTLRQARFFGVYRPEIGISDLFRAACGGGKTQ